MIADYIHRFIGGSEVSFLKIELKNQQYGLQIVSISCIVKMLAMYASFYIIKGGLKMYQQRSIATVIILSIVTCGIYFYYWMYVTMRDINTYLEIADMDSGIELLICIFCSPYIIYWFYKYAQRISEAQLKNNLAASDDAVVCLILAIFGLSVVSVGIMQSNLNKTWAVVQSTGY